MSPTSLAILAYGWWGLVPLYWKLLARFSSEELILFRILLSFVFLLLLCLLRPAYRKFGPILSSPRLLLGLTASGTLIGFNWYLYVWAVNHGHVIDASLGYFLNPLVNVALGTLLLKERMSPQQKIACALASIGAGILAWQVGGVPWISLLLALSFALYGLLRKTLQVSTIPGTFWETLLLSLPALWGLLWMGERLHFPAATGGELLVLAFCGIVTTVPLLAFAEAAKHMPFSLLGFFQFISPSLQFLLGFFVFHEPFTPLQWLAFAFIWMGLAVFVVHLRRENRLR